MGNYALKRGDGTPVCIACCCEWENRQQEPWGAGYPWRRAVPVPLCELLVHGVDGNKREGRNTDTF